MSVTLERPPRPPRDGQDMMRWALAMNEWALRMWRRSGGAVDAVASAGTTAAAAAATASTAAAATGAISAGASTGFTLVPASVLSVQDVDNLDARIAVRAHTRTEGGATVSISAGLTGDVARDVAYTVYYSDPTGAAGVGGAVAFLATDTPAEAAATGMRRIGEIFVPFSGGYTP